MKKIIALCLVLCTLPVLAACATPEKTEPKTTATKETAVPTETKEEKEVEVYFFYGLYDPNCEAMKAIIKEVEGEMPGAFKYSEFDYDVPYPETEKYGAVAYPTTVIAVNGEMKVKFEEKTDKDTFVVALENVLKEIGK